MLETPITQTTLPPKVNAIAVHMLYAFVIFSFFVDWIFYSSTASCKYRLFVLSFAFFPLLLSRAMVATVAKMSQRQ